MASSRYDSKRRAKEKRSAFSRTALRPPLEERYACIPISDGGKTVRPMWKGDVFAVTGQGLFEIDLIRRTSKESAITFHEKE